MSDGVSVWTLLLLGFGVWFLVEGTIYAIVPDAVRRFLSWAARMTAPELQSAGLWTAVLGAIMVYTGIRLI